ncbi:MAG TPA: hypothetical protein VFE33_07545 [Thermoanaerobaculia bacterium]|nr:hypothetical protein [Thermoanaerobaculia bacterium]
MSTSPNPTPTPTPPPTDKKKVKQRETTYAGKLGDWQRILAPLDANAADLPHLEIPRTQLAALLAQAVGIKKQQAASRATKQTASQQLQTTIIEGQRLAALLRQAVRQHYGPSSPKLTEFNVKVFRGRANTPATPPAPAIELSTTPAATVVTTPKAPSDPASHS